MPAAELSRLRAQINELIARFGSPSEFRTALRDLLEQYSNRAYRAGKAVKPQVLFASYRVPPLVTRQLELELSKTCQEWPEQALEVVEVLWHDSFLEPRLLAAVLLGALPPAYGEAAAQKIQAWAQPEENFRILEALFQNGTSGLRRSQPELLEQIIEAWLNSSQPEYQSIGLWALMPLVQDRVYQNLPAVFRILGPLVRDIPAAVQADVAIVVEALVKRSPAETAFFLRQSLSMAANAGTARLVRRCLPAFDTSQQSSLRAALQAANLN